MAASAEALTGALSELNGTISSFLDRVADQIDQLKTITESGREASMEVNRQASAFIENAAESQKSFGQVADRVADAAESLGEAVASLSSVEEGFDATIAKFGRSQSQASESLVNSANSLTGASKSLSTLGDEMAQGSEALVTSLSTFASTAEQAAESLNGIPEEHKSCSTISFETSIRGVEQFASSLSEQMEEFAAKLQGSTDHRVDQWTENTQQFCNNMTDAVGFLSQTINELEEQSSARDRA